MNLKQKAIKGIAWTVLQNWGSQAVSLIVFFVLARLLQPEHFGLVALANSFLDFMTVFLGKGFAKAIIQIKHLEKAHLDTVFWVNLCVSLILFCGCLLSANWLSGVFQEPELAPILRVFSVLFIIVSLSTVQQALLEREFAFRAIALRSLIGMTLSGIVGITMAVTGFGVWSLVSQQIVYELTAVIVLWQLSGWRPGFNLSLRHLRELWNFGITTLGFNLLTFFHTRTDDLLIGYFIGSTALGYYSIAYRVLTIMSHLLINTSNQVALPTFSRLQDDLERLKQAFYKATQLTSLISFPVFLGTAVLAEELVLVIFGPQWLPAVPVLRILASAGIMRAANFFKSSVLMALNKPHWRLGLGLIDTTLNVIAFVIAVRWGIVAVALAYLLRSCLMFPFGQWVVTLVLYVPTWTYLKKFLSPLISTLVMVTAMLVVRSILTAHSDPLVILMVCSMVGFIVYATCIYVFSPSLFQEVRELTRLALKNSSGQSL